MQMPLNVGVDVAKDHVMVACNEQAFAPRALPNQKRSLQAWLGSLPAGSRIGVEATGGYQDLLADLAHAAGFTVFMLNPKDIHYYARGLGRRAKTDRVDAELIARYVAHEHAQLHAYVPASPEQRQIDRLLRRRARLVSLQVALRTTTQDLTGSRRQIEAVLKPLAGLIAHIESQLEQLTRQSASLREAQTRLQSIAGVGPLVGVSLACTLERLPFAKADAFVAFLGLDPRPCDSGQKVGRRRLTKRGPGEMRRLLYTAAMSASRTKSWRPLYLRYRERGLATTQALIVIARKIARTAWSLHRHHTTFDPQRLSAALT